MGTLQWAEIILDNAEIVRGNFIPGRDEYAVVDDFLTVRLVARVCSDGGVFYEVLADLGTSTTMQVFLAVQALHALYKNNCTEDDIVKYVGAITPNWYQPSAAPNRNQPSTLKDAR